MHRKTDEGCTAGAVRETMGMLPSTVAAETPSRFNRHSMSSRKRVNCEKTSAWPQVPQDSLSTILRPRRP